MFQPYVYVSHEHLSMSFFFTAGHNVLYFWRKADWTFAVPDVQGYSQNGQCSYRSVYLSIGVELQQYFSAFIYKQLLTLLLHHFSLASLHMYAILVIDGIYWQSWKYENHCKYWRRINMEVTAMSLAEISPLATCCLVLGVYVCQYYLYIRSVVGPLIEYTSGTVGQVLCMYVCVCICMIKSIVGPWFEYTTRYMGQIQFLCVCIFTSMCVASFSVPLCPLCFLRAV